MAGNERVTVTFRNARLIFKNFSGKEREYNAEGSRNFAILLDETLAKELLANQWNVKPLKPRPDEDQMYFLKVSVSYKGRPPQCWLVSNINPDTGLGRNKTMLDEELINVFDQLESSRVDLIVTAYDWQLKNGSSGRKAYLQSMYFTMYEDDLYREYAELEEGPAAGGQLALDSAEVSTEWDLEGEVVPD